MERLLALLEVLVPVRLWPSRQAMVEMVNQATETVKGLLNEYRASLPLIDKSASKHGIQGGFVMAGVEARQRILESLMWQYPRRTSEVSSYYLHKIYQSLERMSQSEDQRRFRDLVARDLLKRFYTGDMAWKLAGYSRYPGVPGDPREYVQPRPLER